MYTFYILYQTRFLLLLIFYYYVQALLLTVTEILAA